MPEGMNGGSIRFSNSQAAFDIPPNDHIHLDGILSRMIDLIVEVQSTSTTTWKSNPTSLRSDRSDV
jgi:hypothetical protein